MISRCLQRLAGALLSFAALVAWAGESPAWIPTGMFVAAGGADGRFMLTARMRSEDGGRTWSPYTVLGHHPARIVASPADGRVFYALTGGYLREPSVLPTGPMLHRTGDGGATWQLVAERVESAPGHGIGNLAPGAQADLLYGMRMAASTCFTGLCTFASAEAMVSRDGGKTWGSLDPGRARGFREIFPAASDPSVVYAATRSSVYRSVDQGATWKPIRAFAPGSGFRVVVDRGDPSTVYVHDVDGLGLHVSEDGGATWRVHGVELFDGMPASLGLHLLSDPAGGGRLYLVGRFGEVFESRDRARTWRQRTGFHGVAFAAESANVLVAGSGPTRIFTAGGWRLDLPESDVSLGSELWWNPAAPGSGLTITQHPSENLFVVWFHHDERGVPTWSVVPGGRWIDARTFRGQLYRTRGPAFFDEPFDPARVAVVPMGWATLHFESDHHALFSYQLAGTADGAIPITRQLYGQLGLGTPRSDYADLWWDPKEPGWGLAVNQQSGAVFAAWFVYDAQGLPLWLVMPQGRYDPAAEGPEARFRGALYTARAPLPGVAFDPSHLTEVGMAVLDFAGPDDLRLHYEAFGRSGSRRLSRQPF